MSDVLNDKLFYTTCVEECKGSCCDPWWGIIFYTLSFTKLPDEDRLTRYVAQSIKKRMERIKKSYVTKDSPPRALFKDSEKYNVAVEGSVVTPAGVLEVSIRAMFAFRCQFLSAVNACTIHPTLNDGRDIRPQHCAELGTEAARPGEKGYCRIIHELAKAEGDCSVLSRAVEFEKKASELHLKEGVETIAEAAELVAGEIENQARVKGFGLNDLSGAGQGEQGGQGRQGSPGLSGRPGRNDPCSCGSGKKFKRCHGR
jgi:hypothetical protein